MKLKKEYILHNSDNEVLMVAAGGASFNGIVKGNKTLGVILELLKNETSRDEIVEVIKERYDAPEDVIRRDVDTVINDLEKIGALE